MTGLTYPQEVLIKAFFDRTGEGILPDHLIWYLSTHFNSETILQDAQRYLSDLYFAKQNENHDL